MLVQNLKLKEELFHNLGYGFKSIWIKGFSRKINSVKLFVSGKTYLFQLFNHYLFHLDLNQDVAIGSGGYVAGPAIWGASVMGAKIILMESNSYPGVTTRLLEKYADEVHITLNDSKKYLRKPEKIKVTGNPVRKELGTLTKERSKKIFRFR